MRFSIATACAILLAQSVSASWTFSWREPNGTPYVHHEDSDNNMPCTRISHGKGQRFDWDASRFSSCCISLYSNRACSGNPQGYSCDDWSKDASAALYSYKVDC